MQAFALTNVNSKKRESCLPKMYILSRLSLETYACKDNHKICDLETTASSYLVMHLAYDVFKKLMEK
jgi:hypothetical protein